jgi:hypothetical protein
LVNSATGTNSLTILGTASSGTDTINIGRLSSTNNKTYAIAIGNNAQTNDYNAVAIGRDSQAIYDSSVAIGFGAKVRGSGVGVAIGLESGNSTTSTAKCCTCIGAYARASAPYAIQINASDTSQTNSEQGTLAVALRHNNTGVNYKLLDSDGTIPEARLADTTNAQQGDVLTLDSTGNAVWQAGSGGGGSYTAGTGIDITNNAINVQMPVKYNDDNSYAIGIGTQLGAFVYNSVAIGTMASAETDAVNIGGGGPVPQGTISIGNFQSTPTERGVVLFHTQDGNYNYHTYKMLEVDGTVPADRLASTANLADGNYRLRCTITNGVPTLSWVAE